MAIIEVKHLHKVFGDLEVLKDISFNVEEGEVICLIGPSGSGKSTLLRCLNKLEEKQDGDIVILGENISEIKKINQFRENIGKMCIRDSFSSEECCRNKRYSTSCSS